MSKMDGDDPIKQRQTPAELRGMTEKQWAEFRETHQPKMGHGRLACHAKYPHFFAWEFSRTGERLPTPMASTTVQPLGNSSS